MPRKIVIEPTSIRGERGQYYRVYFKGAVLIDDTWVPIFDACRALVTRNITGCLEVWRAGKATADLIVPDIAKAAGCTIEENEKRGPRFVRWRPRPEHGISRESGILPEADLEPEGLRVAN